MALAEEDDDAYEHSGPESVLASAGFSDEQAAALVEAMRMCMDETEAASAAPAPKGKGKGGVDMALVFAGPKKGK